MSQLTDFYSGNGTDGAGRKIGDIWAWNDDELEEVHDYIQWLFPTPTPSSYHRNAPLLTDEDIAEFQSDETMRNHLRRSYSVFLRFLGLSLSADGSVTEGADFEKRCPEIWTYANHNWLRISRVLMSTRLLGLDKEALALIRWLKTAYSKGIIGAADGHSRSEAETSMALWIKNANA